jgi:hypothetical protein
MRLFFREFNLQFRDETLQALIWFRISSSDQDHEVITVPDQFGFRISLGPVFIQGMEINVRQQGTENTSLRRSLFHQFYFVLFEYPTSEPPPNEPFIRDLSSDEVDEHIVVDRIKVGRIIRTHPGNISISFQPRWHLSPDR